MEIKYSIGNKPPDFELPDTQNQIVKLCEITSERTILIFYRGWW